MKVLIIEDDSEIVEVVSIAFKIRWPEVELVSSHLGERGLELVETESPDAVILDLGLPDTSGFDVLKGIREFSNVPVLILTVRGEENDVVRGLEWGADDYMVKPFRQMELLSRVRALIRRTNPFETDGLLINGQLHYNTTTRQLFNGPKEILLTRTEGVIMHNLMKNAGQVVTYGGLAESVWGDDYPGAVESLRVYIRRLREKIETNPDLPQLILTRSSVGYMLVK